MTEPCPLQQTLAARERIHALDGQLRLSLQPGGCCGTAYAFALEEQAGDFQFKEDGLTLCLMAEATDILKGAKLDYGSCLKSLRFRVLNNLNTPLRCACNRSFG